MKVYWINFSDVTMSPLGLGMGVTAYDEADARCLAGHAAPNHVIASVRPVDSIADLDQGHVVPNMGNFLKRGIWFPLGYEQIQ